MADSKDEPTPTLRQRQSQQVRDELRASFIALLVERGIHAFSLHDVAVAAGVSDRTLYRYYPSREALIDDVQSHALTVIEGAKSARMIADVPGAQRNRPETVAGTFEVFEEHAELVRASALIRQSGLADPQHEARTSDIREFVAGFDVHPDALDALSTLVRMLTSSEAWMRMTSADFGMESREAGLTAHWAVQVLVEAALDVDGPLHPTFDDEDSDGQ